MKKMERDSNHRRTSVHLTHIFIVHCRILSEIARSRTEREALRSGVINLWIDHFVIEYEEQATMFAVLNIAFLLVELLFSSIRHVQIYFLQIHFRSSHD